MVDKEKDGVRRYLSGVARDRQKSGEASKSSEGVDFVRRHSSALQGEATTRHSLEERPERLILLRFYHKEHKNTALFAVQNLLLQETQRGSPKG
jgi:hypothetical protein